MLEDKMNRTSNNQQHNQELNSTLKTHSRAAFHRRKMGRIAPNRLVQAIALISSLVLIIAGISKQTQAQPLLLVSDGHDRAPTADSNVVVHQSQQQQHQQQQHQKQRPAFNNLENIISELLDDVGNRLKKNKLHSIKQTLRFGRSDPYMAPTSSGDDYETLYDKQRQQDEPSEDLN